MNIIKRQFITDIMGNPIGIILPLEEYALVEPILNQQIKTKKSDPSHARPNQMEQAVTDIRFIGLPD